MKAKSARLLEGSRDVDTFIQEMRERLKWEATQVICTVERCVEDQGLYDKRFGKIVVCSRCGKVRQALNQCKCGAP